MALLKFLQGNADSLDNYMRSSGKEGWVYITKDTGDMYIQAKDNSTDGKIHLNSNCANKLRVENTGNVNLPVYFENGIPVKATGVATTTSLNNLANATSLKMDKSNPTGTGSLSLNRKTNTTIGDYSVAIGSDTTASGNSSYAEGKNTQATGSYSHAEGYNTSAQAYGAHAEGANSHAFGEKSHVEGSDSAAFGKCSHAEGEGSSAAGDWQHVQGHYNIADTTSAHIVGNGTATIVSNAHTLDWGGNAWFAGNVYVGSTSGTNKDEGSVKLIRSDDIASDTKAGLTIVYPEAKCTTFTSDVGTATPKAMQKAAKQFAIPRPNYNTSTHKGSATANSVTRFDGTEGEVKDSKIIIEDVTNTKDTSKKANVLVIPAEGNKKMVYGYCTDQTDGTSFIGGVFDASATSYPYASGLAIGGTSGNLLWKGKQVATTDMIFSGNYNDLTNKPTIPIVNNATLTIQKNGTNVATFTANSASNVTANITVPTGAAADKGVDTSISAASTSTNLPTSKAVAAFVEGKGYKTTDNNDKVTCTLATTTKYYVAGTTSSTTSTTGLTYDTGVYVDTTAGKLVATSVYGAVWNDYAEYRETKEDIKPGRVVCETGKGDLVLSTERLQAGANIVSDTFGFIIGETSKAKTPIAVSGRALAYPLEDRILYAAGDAVCAGPNGTVSKMTREEIREYPDRILGTVSEIPDYEIWGENDTIVDGRIWIKVR